MTLIPNRTVANQVAAELRDKISKATWSDWLPSQRSLCQAEHASRNSVRTALNQLKSEGIIESVQRIGNRIVLKPRRALNGNNIRTVGIIIPETVAERWPLLASWIAELKDLIVENGCRIVVHEGYSNYGNKSRRVLEKLVKQNPHDAWLLFSPSKAMQYWFQNYKAPCIVLGSVFPNIALPGCDINFRAICRHAVGVLLRHGHRCIALLNSEPCHAGDLESELGFLDAVQATREPTIVHHIVYHRNCAESVERAIKRLLSHRIKPTGLIVCNAGAYISAATIITQLGFRIPQDISLISRNNDSLLQFLVPAPARYVVSPHAYAKRLIGPILQLVNRDPIAHPHVRLLPRFVPGGSLGPPPVNGERRVNDRITPI